MTTTIESPPYRVIGTRPIRPDGVDKVTGHANYAADVQLPRMLHARLKKSPYAHARIKSIDISKAAALPGVEAVVTGRDFADLDKVATTEIGMNPAGTPRRFVVGNFIAVDKVLYYGHPVAAVAATDVHVAEDALDLIEVEYERLPPVMTALEATRPDAPILHDDLRTVEPLGQVPDAPKEDSLSGVAGDPAPQEPADRPTNVAAHVQIAIGDVEATWAQCDVVVEDEFQTATYHQGYLEPHSATASWSPDGSLVIYCSSQGSFIAVRDPLAQILQMSPARIRVVPMEIGGGFGGKARIYCEPIAAMLAKKAQRPVKLTLTREEVLLATGPTSGTYIRARMGARKDGTILAAKMWAVYEAGAFPGSPVGAGVTHAFGNYDIPNMRIDGYDVVVNRPRNCAYRAPGVPQVTLACEALIDELANRLDIDGMELRLRNAAQEGDRRPDGTVLPVNGNVQVMRAIRDTEHYRSELSGKNRGRGVALGFWTPHFFQYGINATVNIDGTVIVNGGAMDIGGLRATEAMTMAEVLGIPYEDVRVRTVDTDSIGWSGYTGGSGTGAGTSASIVKVANEIRRRMIERVSQLWECDQTAIHYEPDGALTGPDTVDGKARAITFRELAARLQETGGPISGHADEGGAITGPVYGGHIVDVEVDDETGKVTILRYTAVTDVGKALHPSYVEGQIQGGAAQGVGMALTEEYFYDDEGVLRNASFLDYRMPTTLDLPMIDTVLIEVPNPGHPFGARGVGEISIIPPMGAIANAIYHATGVRSTSMPASPRVMIETIIDRGAGG